MKLHFFTKQNGATPLQHKDRKTEIFPAKFWDASLSATSSEVDVSNLSLSDEEGDLNETLQYSKELQAKFEGIRKKDYAKLDQQQCKYFDYTGGMVAPESLLMEHHIDLMTTILGNPHSEHDPSKTATNIEQEARAKVLQFCGADPDEYVCIWTPNASGALKLVGESFPFGRKGAYIYAPDCHNSLLGILRFAENKKARVKGFDFLPNSLCYDFKSFEAQMKKLGKATESSPKLLGIPAESNVSGYTHNVKRYADHAHSFGWDVCVDAAAFAPTKKIEMAELGFPDFLSMSFYKIFGYPTGVGCLVAKKEALCKLERPWFAGGTVRVVGATSNSVADFMVDGHHSAKHEDGTINYTSLKAVTNGLKYIEAVGSEDLNKHIQYFSALIESRLRSLYWPNGMPLVKIPTIDSADEGRGPVLPVLFLTPTGSLLPHKIVEKVFVKKGICARTGCFCNPGSSLQMLFSFLQTFGHGSQNEFVDKHMMDLKKTNRVDRFLEANAHQGMIRISVGLPTNMADVDALINCIKKDILAKPFEIERMSNVYKKTGPVPYSKC